MQVKRRNAKLYERTPDMGIEIVGICAPGCTMRGQLDAAKRQIVALKGRLANAK